VSGSTVAAGRRRSGQTFGAVRAALVSRAALEAYGVVFGFLVMAIVVTWPVFLHAQSIITGGGYGGDQVGYIWDYWYLGHFGVKLWGTGVQHEISAPFGREYAGGINATILTTLFPAWVGAKIAGPLFAYNVVVISGLTLSAASMYLLVRWLGLGVIPAIWSGAAFMLFPYEQIRATGHLVLAHLECLPILLMACLWWTERPSWRRAIALAAGFGFCAITNPYYGLMGAVTVAVFMIAAVVRLWRGGGLQVAARRVGEALAAVVVIVLIPIGLLFASSSGSIESTIERNRFELDIYGARITDYVLPPDAGIWRALLGTFSWSNPGGERMNFVGWVTIILAIVALVLGWRLRGRLSGRQRLLLAIGPPLVLVLMWFSLALPTHWFGVEIPVPSDWIFDSFPYLRGYARFVAPVMCVLLAMGAVGLWLLMRGRSVTTRLSIASTALILLFLDLAPTVPLHSAEPVQLGSPPTDELPTWTWLKGHEPGAIVFEMPGGPNELAERYYQWGQITHRHPITNGNSVRGQLGPDFQVENAAPYYPGTPQNLSSLGIDLVTIEPFAYTLVGQPVPDIRHPSPGYVVVRTFADGSAIWRVTAAPAQAVAVRRNDWWWPPEPEIGAVWRWMKDVAKVTVVPHDGRTGVYRATFKARGSLPLVVYTLAIRSPDGFVDRVRVGPAKEQTITATIHVTDPRTDIYIQNEGPSAREKAPGDPRIVSVQMTAWDVRRAHS
jgi:hypothetical protein